MKRTATALAAVVALAMGSVAGPGDWAMVQKDSNHTGFSEKGPAPPLKKAWFATPDDPETNFTTWPVVFGGTVYASSGPGVIAVEARTGKRSWYTHPVGGQEIAAPAVDEAAVYVPVPPSLMLALDRQTGQEIWRFQAEDELEVSPTLHEGKLFFGSIRTQYLYCLDATDGSLVWKTATPEFEPSAIPVVSGGMVIFSADAFETSATQIYGLDAANGQEVWRAPQRESNSSPSILDDRVIIGGGDFFAYALDVKTGKEVWKSPVVDKFSVRNSPAIAFGDVFLVDRIGNAYRLDGKTGKRKWFLADLEATYEQSFPVVAGKTLFIGGGSGRINAIDTDDGKLLWSEDVGGQVYSGAADSERFYFGVRNENEGLYAYEHDPTGKLVKPENPSTVKSVLQALLIVLAIFGAILLIARRMRNRINRAGRI